MSIQPTTETTQTLTKESTPGRSTTSCSLSGTSLFDVDHNDLKEHLKNNQIQQSVLDEYLLSGFQMAQKKDRELRQITQALTLFLEFGAKWKDGVLLKNQMTPHHLICQSKGDNHQLLDLIITHFHGTLINSKSHDGMTALLYAVKNVNLKCCKSLLANGANVNLEDDDSYAGYSSLFPYQHTLSPIVEAIKKLQLPNPEYSSIAMPEILDLLLDSGVDVNKPYCLSKPKPIEYAIYQGNVHCVKKLIEKGSRLKHIVREDMYIWSKVACMGSVDLLKCMLDNGIDKECTDREGKSLLSYTVFSGNVESIRYLLDLGVAITSCTTKANEITCKHCGKSRLLIDIVAEDEIHDPHMMACQLNMLHVVRLLEERGNQNFKSMNALRYAVLHSSLEVVKYLLCKYSYPLNVEYARISGDDIDYQNILIEACRYSSCQVIELLVDHGVEPNKRVCEEKCPTALTTAIAKNHMAVIARFIQCGADINCRSYDKTYGHVYPFEAAVLYNNTYAAEILLISGCSCGVFSLDIDHKFKVKVKPQMKKLMKKWNVPNNKVTSLQIQCRRVILMQLSPKGVDKIDDGSLPQSIVKYLSICELDDIIM